MVDFRDGEYYKDEIKKRRTAKQRQEFRYVLYVTIFGDDFCISNPLGGASKGQTYTAVYMRILNCRAQYQKRQLDTILVMMCPNQFNKRLRFATRPIASCLQRLSKKGFEVEIEGEKRRIYVKLFGLSGDNLFCNYAYGLGGSFTHGKFCRFCTIDGESIRKYMYFREEDRAKWQAENFEIPLDRNTFKHTVDRHGVVRLHAFDFRFYTELGNINRIQLLDIFHDTLQGVMVYLIGFIVRKVKIRGDGKRFQNLNSIIESTYFLRGRVNFKPNLEIRGSGYQKLEFYQVLNSNNTNYS